MSDTSLERTVEKLRVLAEANEQTLKLIAEGHGAKLDSLSARLDSHDRKLASHDRKLDSLSARLDSHDRKLDSMSARLDSHDHKLDQIIQALAPVPQIRDFIERVAHDHEERIKAIEKAAPR